jgi:putative redox protein
MASEIAPAAPDDRMLVAETGLGRLQMVARRNDNAFVVDEPQADGGLGSGPNPYDLLCAALGSCKAMTMRLYAERKGWPLTRVQVAVRHQRASLEARDRFDCTVTLEGPLDEAQRARLLEIAGHCPVHKTLERGSDVSTSLRPSGATTDGSEHMRDMEEAAAA